MSKPNVYIFSQLSDNYGYLLKHPHGKESIIIDPSDLEQCEKILEFNDCKPTYILLTHHHDDHIAAVEDLREKYNSIVIGNKNDEKLPKLDQAIEPNQNLKILNCSFKVIPTPGHTMEHICYFEENYHFLFSGDTLFNLGCGRMFEGTPDLFWKSLDQLNQLPDDSLVYCGHEYTLANFHFAASIDPQNQDLQDLGKWIKKQDLECRPTIPFQLGIQKKANPFLRCGNKIFHKQYGSENPQEVFGKMRLAKDNF